MYLLVWIAFLQIIIIIFPVLGLTPTYYLHTFVGLIVVGVAMASYFLVRKTACPDRIKRISKTTAILAVIQGILGIVLLAGIMLHFGTVFREIILFIHVVNALAIITQASSSATAFDMWEQKEFPQSS